VGAAGANRIVASIASLLFSSFRPMAAMHTLKAQRSE
jgi:hypothetical protein